MMYMTRHMKWGRVLAALILLVSMAAQAVGSAGVISRVRLKAACYTLLTFTGEAGRADCTTGLMPRRLGLPAGIRPRNHARARRPNPRRASLRAALQPVVYGQLGDPDFVFRSLTQLGGLLLLLRHEGSLGGSRRPGAELAFAGLAAEAAGRSGASGARLQLLGRVLLMGIFFSQGAVHIYHEGLSLLPVLRCGACAFLAHTPPPSHCSPPARAQLPGAALALGPGGGRLQGALVGADPGCQPGSVRPLHVSVLDDGRARARLLPVLLLQHALGDGRAAPPRLLRARRALRRPRRQEGHLMSAWQAAAGPGWEYMMMLWVGGVYIRVAAECRLRRYDRIARRSSE